MQHAQPRVRSPLVIPLLRELASDTGSRGTRPPGLLRITKTQLRSPAVPFHRSIVVARQAVQTAETVGHQDARTRMDVHRLFEQRQQGLDHLARRALLPRLDERRLERVVPLPSLDIIRVDAHGLRMRYHSEQTDAKQKRQHAPTPGMCSKHHDLKGVHVGLPYTRPDSSLDIVDALPHGIVRTNAPTRIAE